MDVAKGDACAGKGAGREVVQRSLEAVAAQEPLERASRADSVLGVAGVGGIEPFVMLRKFVMVTVPKLCTPVRALALPIVPELFRSPETFNVLPLSTFSVPLLARPPIVLMPEF